MTDLIAGSGIILERIAPDLDTDPHVREQEISCHRGNTEGEQSDHRQERIPRRHKQHDQVGDKEDQCRTQIRRDHEDQNMRRRENRCDHNPAEAVLRTQKSGDGKDKDDLYKF